MRPQQIIERKRDGRALSTAEIESFVSGVVDGRWADYQISALVMAMFINGLTRAEQTSITRAMLESGTIMDLSDIDAPKADKHSTGGVGDKTSLLVAPIAAACGLAVPMISGRALGHTGGTLDKLESIAGYNVKLSFPKIKTVIRACGFALAGQTRSIAPADRKLYALRDATATVPYIPLIVASIMSKKLAEGLDALTLDVKTGKGAFIKSLPESKKLAHALCETGRKFGVNTGALITDMSEPLGKFVGNSLEVFECLTILRGESDPQMYQTLTLSIELTTNMLVQCGVASTLAHGRKLSTNAINSGEALERFRKNVELQGGDPRIFDDPTRLLKTRTVSGAISAKASGYISGIDAYAVGSAVCSIGGGRVKAEDKIDHSVGYESRVKVGDRVDAGATLGIVHCRSGSQAAAVSEKLHAAYKISGEKPKISKLVRARI